MHMWEDLDASVKKSTVARAAGHAKHLIPDARAYFSTSMTIRHKTWATIPLLAVVRIRELWIGMRPGRKLWQTA